MSEFFLKYVRHSAVQAHLDRGWVIVSRQCDMAHHGAHGVIMELKGMQKNGLEANS